MKIIKANSALSTELLNQTNPVIEHALLDNPARLRRVLFTKAVLSPKKSIQDPATVQTQEIKTRLQSKGFSVSQDGDNLRATVSGVQGTKAPGIELKVNKTQPAAFGVFGTSKIGREVEVTQKGTGAVLSHIGGLQTPAQIDSLVTRNDIKAANPITDRTQPRSVDTVKLAKLRKQLSSRSQGQDID